MPDIPGDDLWNGQFKARAKLQTPPEIDPYLISGQSAGTVLSTESSTSARALVDAASWASLSLEEPIRELPVTLPDSLHISSAIRCQLRLHPEPSAKSYWTESRIVVSSQIKSVTILHWTIHSNHATIREILPADKYRTKANGQICKLFSIEPRDDDERDVVTTLVTHIDALAACDLGHDRKIHVEHVLPWTFTRPKKLHLEKDSLVVTVATLAPSVSPLEEVRWEVIVQNRGGVSRRLALSCLMHGTHGSAPIISLQDDVRLEYVFTQSHKKLIERLEVDATRTAQLRFFAVCSGTHHVAALRVKDEHNVVTDILDLPEIHVRS